MGKPKTATLDADDEICGPLFVDAERMGLFTIDVTGTITVTLQASADLGATYIAVPDAAYTADTVQTIDSPGVYRLIASGVSGGSAICTMQRG
jgi:hypothetical protein